MTSTHRCGRQRSRVRPRMPACAPSPRQCRRSRLQQRRRHNCESRAVATASITAQRRNNNNNKKERKPKKKGGKKGRKSVSRPSHIMASKSSLVHSAHGGGTRRDMWGGGSARIGRTAPWCSSRRRRRRRRRPLRFHPGANFQRLSDVLCFHLFGCACSGRGRARAHGSMQLTSDQGAHASLGPRHAGSGLCKHAAGTFLASAGQQTGATCRVAFAETWMEGTKGGSAVSDPPQRARDQQPWIARRPRAHVPQSLCAGPTQVALAGLLNPAVLQKKPGQVGFKGGLVRSGRGRPGDLLPRNRSGNALNKAAAARICAGRDAVCGMACALIN